MICVYKITSPSGRVYVGSTKDYAKRINYYGRYKCKSQTKLYYSLKKYGASEHIFEVLQECELSDMRRLEAEYGTRLNCLDREAGLNCNLPNPNDEFIGVSEETRLKQSLAKKGKNAGENSHWFGKGHSAESKEKMSKARMGNQVWIGKKHKQESKDKIRAARQGKYKGENNFNYGNKNSDNPISKLILNTQTGIYYFGSREASESIGKNTADYLRKQLNGQKPNYSPFIYV